MEKEKFHKKKYFFHVQDGVRKTTHSNVHISIVLYIQFLSLQVMKKIKDSAIREKNNNQKTHIHNLYVLYT